MKNPNEIRIVPARWRYNEVVIKCPDNEVAKAILEGIIEARFVTRENGYCMSAAAAERFLTIYKELKKWTEKNCALSDLN